MTHRTYTLLIVEDAPTDRELYRRLLLKDSNCDYDLLEAESVVEGLELCQTKSIDAILLDYQLPDGDGLQFLAALAAQSHGKLPPVVMLTGQGDETIAVRAMKLGAEDYLVKSNLTPELLQLTISTAISSDRFRQELAQIEIARIEAECERDRFFNLSIDLLAIGSFDGYFTRLNPAFEQVLGFTNTELMAEPFINFVHSDDRERTIAGAQSLVAGGSIASFENRYRCKDGSYRWISWNASPYPPNQIWYATGHDITERQRTERDLRESQERLRTGIEVAGLGLARFDYATNLVALSPEAAALYGFDPKETFVTREQIHATFHPDERAALEKTIAQVVDPDGKGWFAQDHRVVWQNGEVRCLSVRKQVFFDRSAAVVRPSYAILAAIDTTERNQTLAALEARNQELDSFVHIVSHDLKAPLRAVANLSEWIEEDLAGALTPANQEQMSLLRNRIYRMEATIDGLLDYAKIGRTEDTYELVIVAQLLAETVDSLAPPPTFTISIDQNMPTLHANRLLLAQVFANLIGNAIKHHDRIDGSIQINIAEHHNCYEFAIADDGPGISPDQHDRIFQIFQAVNPQKRTDSTGIGLAIVKKIIETEGGTIRLESEIGQGTTFYFTWPKPVTGEKRKPA